MRLRRLLHTTAIRLALRYAVLYALLIIAGFGILYWTTSRYVDVQVGVGLLQESERLVQLDLKYGRERLIAFIAEAQEKAARDDERIFLLQTPTGENLAGSLRGWPPGLAVDGQVHNVWIEDSLIPGQPADDDELWPMIGVTLNDGSRLLLVQRVDEAEDLLEFILGTMAVILTVSIGLALTMGWLLGRSLLARIDTINFTAKGVTADELTRRIPLSEKNDEFDELAGHLNDMLERIEQLLSGMRQVTDNIAHDLRRPLARLRGRIEVTLRGPRDQSEYRDVLQETLEDADELMQTFSALLEIAQAEAGSFRGDWNIVDISALLEDLGQLYSDEAEVQGKLFELQVEPGLQLKGNRHLLGQGIRNLLDNAFNFTPIGSTIKLTATASCHLLLAVSDNGAGIPADLREKVLERFIRLAPERSSAGNGLGLSLVKAVADLHEARLLLEDCRPGLRVSLSFNL